MRPTPRSYHPLVLVLISILVVENVEAATTTCTPTHVGSVGNVASLVACINAANISINDTVIDLSNASFTISGTTLFQADGANGLPSIVNSNSIITIQNGSIERGLLADTPSFRILRIARGAVVVLSSLTIENGDARGDVSLGGDNGGGIYNLGELELRDVIVVNNSADNFGGGIYNAGAASLRLLRSTISKNFALDSSLFNGGGGGIYNSATIISILESTISGNRTQGYGAGINNQGTISRIADSTISGNLAVLDINETSPASGAGGGIYNSGGDVFALIINTTIAENSAYEGGGIYNNGSIAISNSTITGNSAHNGGGGIYNNNTGILSKLISTIVANNVDTNSLPSAKPDVNNFGTIVEESFNLIGDNAGAPTLVNGNNNDIVGFDPLLGPLQDNGGFTFTAALLPGSLALNNGSNPYGVSRDQRNELFLRLSGGRVDIGAYEAEGCEDIDEDGICDDFDNCDAIANPAQVDTDDDGVGDDCDNCRDEFNPDQGHECDDDELVIEDDEIPFLPLPLAPPPFLPPFSSAGLTDAEALAASYFDTSSFAEAHVAPSSDASALAANALESSLRRKGSSKSSEDTSGGCSGLDTHATHTNSVMLMGFLVILATRNRLSRARKD